MSEFRPPFFSRALPAGIFIFVFFLFAGAFDNRFTLDSMYFMRDARVVSMDFGAIFTTDWWNRPAEEAGDGGGLYRPVALSALAICRSLTSEKDLREGRSPPVHVLSAALNAAGAVLRYLLLLLLLTDRPRRHLMAALGGLAGGVHPVAVEAVGTAVGIAESLSMAGVMLSLYALVRWKRERRRGWLLVHGASFLLALLSKENAAVVVVAAPLMLWLASGLSLKRSLTASLPALLVLAGWGLLRFAVLGTLTRVGDPVHAGFPPLVRIASALAVIGSYDLPALLWPPTHLPNPTFQELPPATDFGDPRVLLGMLAILVWVGLFLFSLRREKVAAFGLFLFAAALFPLTNILIPIGAIAATRFLYLPVAGLSMALAAFWGRTLFSSPPALKVPAWVLAVWLIPVMAGFTISEIRHWRDQATLFATAVERAPSAVALRNLAVEKRDQGMARKDRRLLKESYELMRRAAEQAPVEIPGTDLAVENSLELAFMSSMDAANALLSLLGGDLNEASKLAAWAEKIAARGMRQAARGLARTNWRKERAAALALRARILFEMAGRTRDPARKDRLLTEAVDLVGRGLLLRPGDFRLRLLGLMKHQLRGEGAAYERELRKLFAESRSSWKTDPQALDVALAMAAFLDANGRRMEALTLRVEAAEAGAQVMDPALLFSVFRSAAAARAPRLRRAAAVIGRVLMRRLPGEAASQRAEVSRVLASLGVK